MIDLQKLQTACTDCPEWAEIVYLSTVQGHYYQDRPMKRPGSWAVLEDNPILPFDGP